MSNNDPTRRSAFSILGGSALAAGAWCEQHNNALDTNGLSANFLARLQSLAKTMATGGRIDIPAGSNTLDKSFVFAGQRINIVGDGPNVSVVAFDPETSQAAFVLATSGSGGQYQSSIQDIGFISSNTITKTGIDVTNGANINFDRIAFPGGGWLGTESIGIRTQGRQFIRIRDCDIVCARPIVIGANVVAPSLAADFTSISGSEISCTSATGAAIEAESGAILTNFVVRDTALTGGADAFRYVDRSSAVSPNANLQFENVRTEQGRSVDGWSFRLESANNTIQSVLFVNVRLDNRRNGIRARKVERLTLVNCDLDQTEERILLDMIGVPGSVLTLLNCWGQMGGRIALRNMKRVTSVRSDVSSPIGPFEQWVYDDGTIQPFTEINGWEAGAPFTLDAGETHVICGNDCAGRVDIYASNGVSAAFRLFGTNNAAFEVDDPAGQFSARFDNPGSTNVVCRNGCYILQNNTGRSLSYRYRLSGPGNAGF